MRERRRETKVIVSMCVGKRSMEFLVTVLLRAHAAAAQPSVFLLVHGNLWSCRVDTAPKERCVCVRRHTRTNAGAGEGSLGLYKALSTAISMLSLSLSCSIKACLQPALCSHSLSLALSLSVSLSLSLYELATHTFLWNRVSAAKLCEQETDHERLCQISFALTTSCSSL